jgi:uncharacterized Zn-finger protein
MAEEIVEEEKDEVRFSISVSLDRDQFFRRTCPYCGRDFKTLADPNDLASILQPAFRRVESEIGGISIISKDMPSEKQYYFCPYCNQRAEASDTFTDELIAYVKRFVMREYVLPRVNRMFSDFADGLNSGGQSGGFISIEIKADFDSTLPPRPVSGPEAPDMTQIEMLCCEKKIKIHDEWFDLEICPYCGEQVRII